ncbi:MAG: xanthine dehydrogenase family protein subunit M [Alphaproteobacteria bacterium]|nr:xanthine dehydrogenase family protein subunit M [Alphaproteobacteria bacterium]
MKPPPFSYHLPGSVEEAVGLLGSLENAKLLAGGQSLMPMLNMRFVLPDHVIDLNGIGALSGISAVEGGLRIGGMTRQRDIEFSDPVKTACPLLSEAILQVGHRQTRNRGTVGGSLSHLDPSAEIPAVCAAVDAEIAVTGPNGTRTIPFAEFPAGYMMPAMEPDELLVSVFLPSWKPGHGYGFEEFARRHGDFAIVSAAALIEAEGGRIKRASVTVSGVGPAPVRLRETERALAGQAGSEELFRSACESARGIEALEDVHAPASYRQHLAAVLSRRALVKAWSRIG